MSSREKRTKLDSFGAKIFSGGRTPTFYGSLLAQFTCNHLQSLVDLQSVKAGKKVECSTCRRWGKMKLLL